MAQAKKKQATRTAKKQTRSAKCGQTHKQCQSQRARKTQYDNSERNHIYAVTIMGMIAAILLCANAAMMMI